VGAQGSLRGPRHAACTASSGTYRNLAQASVRHADNGTPARGRQPVVGTPVPRSTGEESSPWHRSSGRRIHDSGGRCRRRVGRNARACCGHRACASHGFSWIAVGVRVTSAGVTASSPRTQLFPFVALENRGLAEVADVGQGVPVSRRAVWNHNQRALSKRWRQSSMVVTYLGNLHRPKPPLEQHAEESPSEKLVWR
jgi:hypothetical protein